MMDGNLCDFLSRNIDHIGEMFVGVVYVFTCLRPFSKGHIQIAQVPYRHEPDEQGEINFPFVFQTLRSLGYKGWLGCEYIPRGQLHVMIAGGHSPPLVRIPPSPWQMKISITLLIVTTYSLKAFLPLGKTEDGLGWAAPFLTRET